MKKSDASDASFVTVSMAGMLLGCTVQSVTRFIRTRQLRARRRGSSYVLNAADVLALRDRRARTTRRVGRPTLGQMFSAMGRS